jgi:hypothetical protein
LLESVFIKIEVYGGEGRIDADTASAAVTARMLRDKLAADGIDQGPSHAEI